MGFQVFFGFGHMASDPKQIEKDENDKKAKTQAEFRLAVSEFSKVHKKNFTTFLPCEAVGNVADNILKFFKKGDVMYFEGKLKTTKGQADKGLTVLVSKFHFTPRDNSASPDNQPNLNEDGVEGEEDSNMPEPK